ncbi:MAG: TGS domain-containing protein, partial [Chloroflexota bacterium]
DQVYVYTPKGDIKPLPKGATPIDFAYHIHTDLGHRCQGARVNGRLVPLNYTLSNGDTVEIMPAKDKGPSLDWLNPDLGYARTAHGMDKIRQWFRRQERSENITRGRDLLTKEFKRLGIALENAQEMARLCGYATPEDLLASLGYGGITPRQVALKVAGEPTEKTAAVHASAKAVPPTVVVPGVSNVLTKLGRCCHPLPNDDIVGYVTRYAGITVHQRSCRNVAGSQVSKERLVDVKWGGGAQAYPASVQVDAVDRVGLIRDITMVVAEDKVNIAEFSTSSHSGDDISLKLTLEVRNLEQLSRILFKIQNIRGVRSAERLSSESQAVVGGR